MNRLALLSLFLFGATACKNEKKPVPRTEPWPAPVASRSSTSAVEQRVSYVIDAGPVHIDLPARKKKLRGTFSRLAGTIDWDPEHPEHVTAEIQVDLLSLSLDAGQGDDPLLVARAFDWLELSPLRPAEDRERDRFAVLRISSCDRSASGDGAQEAKSASCTARGDLTLHRFRVPIAFDVSVDIEKEPTGGPGPLVIRTRRPLVVSLARYDIQPRSGSGDLLPTEATAASRSEIGRDALLSAELRALPKAGHSGPKKP